MVVSYLLHLGCDVDDAIVLLLIQGIPHEDCSLEFMADLSAALALYDQRQQQRSEIMVSVFGKKMHI